MCNANNLSHTLNKAVDTLIARHDTIPHRQIKRLVRCFRRHDLSVPVDLQMMLKSSAYL